jgi:hypothetical protein
MIHINDSFVTDAIGSVFKITHLREKTVEGSNPAEAVGFFRANKNPQHALLRKGSKAVGPMS